MKLGFDGQFIFLHPLNVKMLQKEFGMYHLFPESISAPILELEEVTQTEEVRRRTRYLGHLPIGCDYLFCELDLSNLVSDDTLNAFSIELARRQKRREERSKPESKNKSIMDTSDFILEETPRLEPNEPEIYGQTEVTDKPQPQQQQSAEDDDFKRTGGSYAHAVSGIMSNIVENPPLSQTSEAKSAWHPRSREPMKSATSSSDSSASSPTPTPKTTKSSKNRNLLLSTSGLRGHYR
jgi:hypothetical protein